jgi:hypothetical protein
MASGRRAVSTRHQAGSFLLSKATPYSVRLPGAEGKVQALLPDQAVGAELFGGTFSRQAGH